ncbi:Hint domain-containing protein [Sinorhizobium alkalisoli]|uniref:Uncharacterized protein n=1 Tax=Sinorhizobium alkalisoli TaxID=1752398 RepID=A0A1E3VCF9_9HYPH|nr:Hint domain-containing protein [Sinorhizobium alkalisoli]MCA1494106.1 Hint domain-containing protein [Ensifer sp. NBAIM29]MCG5480000.1 Hint domain-containing protein [Sinorhizobium alkalisoli]ODR91127.1 hypothetical protein A8M32_09895 [Sinorhizobium alkalisoli]QFI66818.1 putative autotransporter protein [Sinorhizobium alkalisoli]
MPEGERRARVNQARRHFLGFAAAAAARVVAMGSLVGAALPSKSEAGGRAWWKLDHPGRGHGHGRGKNDPMCLLRGTAIRTPKGEVPIEELRIGDLVETVNGVALPIKWIGRHLYRRTAPTWSKDVAPIRIARHALNDESPRNDLYLSARHALLIDGMLVRAQDLVNGTSITRVQPTDWDRLEYFHIMLDSHQVLLAEGAPVESFLLETASYETFTNFAEFARLYPADRFAFMTPFAPYVGYGGREHLKALLHLAVGGPRTMSPLENACSRIAARGEKLLR